MNALAWMLWLVLNQSIAEPSIQTTVNTVVVKQHGGWSVDELLLQDDLRQQLISEVQKVHPHVDGDEVCATMLRLRKSGKLKLNVTQKSPMIDPRSLIAGELAARYIQDRHRVSFDQVLTTSRLLEEFDAEAKRVWPDVLAYDARRAALRLRKSRRLEPELLLRIADWQREVAVHTLEDLRSDHSMIPKQPGVYIFRDATGYLYIGESEDLRARLHQHVTDSDRFSLASYLSKNQQHAITVEVHAFPGDSPMKQVRVRRAYESELIEHRQPRFNVRP